MADPTLFAKVKDPANRADPYPLYAALRETPVARQDDGTYVVSGHAAIRALLFDPRLSSDDLPPTRHPHSDNPVKDWILNPYRNHVANTHRPFIFRDPPDHDALRRHVMTHFTPDRIGALRPRVEQAVDDLLDDLRDVREFDLVERFSYPLPVTVICELLGVPRDDERQFHGWANQLASALEPDQRRDAENRARSVGALDAISDCMRGLISKKRRHPEQDLLSALANEEGGMGIPDLVSIAILLLVAGHETTVNLVTNGLLTLLRFPEHLARLRGDPTIAPPMVEELLRYEPPVHFRTRRALADIAIGDETVPEGAAVALLFAAGNRDPDCFPAPDRFDPDRADNQHFGFGGALHYCVGAPLARLETETALLALARRLEAPRLLADPPPYRSGASLRGPEHLPIRVEAVR